MSDASNPHINVLFVDNKELGKRSLRMLNTQYAYSQNDWWWKFYGKCKRFLLRHLLWGSCEIAVLMRTSVRYVLQSGVCDSSWKIVVFSFLFTPCRLYKADTKRNCFAEEMSLVEGKAISGWCEIKWFSQREVDLVRHCEHDVDEKWLTTLQHKKVRTRRISGSTTGNAGANKDGPTHKDSPFHG